MSFEARKTEPLILNVGIHVGILTVYEGNVQSIAKDEIGSAFEEILTGSKFFNILTVKRNSITNITSKVKHAVDEWSGNHLDLIFLIGQISKSIFLNEKILKGISNEGLSHFVMGNTIIFTFDSLASALNKVILDKGMASEILNSIYHVKNQGSKELMTSSQVSYSEFQQCGSKVKPIAVSERPRESLYPMIPVSEALDYVIKESNTLNTEIKYFRDSFSHVLAEDIVAKEPYPPFNASIKDGYAVLAEDTSEIREVIGAVTPGCKLDFDLKPGCCVRVSTGSAIPDKADAVIQVEDTVVVEKDDLGNEIKIKILKQVKNHFQDIRSIGSDVTANDVLIPKYHKTTSAEIGVMATCGIQKVVVYRKPRVALLSTGDEVLEPDQPLLPGCIRDSNKYSLLYMLKENRINVIDAGIAKDIADDVKSRLITAFAAADIIITTGGVSMGERDILKQVLETDFNAVIQFGRIHMKPGKPTTFSTVSFGGEKKLIFSLPGNPVSAYVCFYLFVIPCIKSLMGYEEPKHTTFKVELSRDLSLDDRPEYYRVSLKCNDSGTFIAYGTGSQQSSRLLSMQNADALLVLPPRTNEIPILKAGTKVDAILLKSI